MREILMELELLYNKMNVVNKEVEKELGNENIPFAKVLYTILKNQDKTELFNTTDEELVRIIQNLQILES